MTRSPFFRLRALAVASVVSLALLASGCAQGGSNEASTGGASAPATQAAGAASDKPSGGPASAKPEPTGPVTDWATVTADASGLSFSAPADWKVIKASEIQADESKLEEIADEAGVSADMLKTAMSTADIYILDQSGAQGSSNNINVLSQTYPASTAVTEDALATAVKSIGATPGQFSTESTANGDAHVLTYTWEVSGQTLQGAAMYVPNAKGEYVSITITTLDSALTDQIVEKIITTAA
ncbi:hypothetical protein [uncultured Actinomyces sp.]|uniref:hypothetical protein n=1 Tax=uncultured Actinomyces sp. TaxID=249061 RepID=UPI00288B8B7A|nr:hypothetical protein [uncultured Actinomyces sp.]